VHCHERRWEGRREMTAIWNRSGVGLREWAYSLPVPPVVRALGEMGLRSARNFSGNDGSHMAAGMAYYSLFSLFPLALGAVSLAGFFVSSEEVQRSLFEFLDGQVPGLSDSDILKKNIQGIVQARGTLSFVSIVGLFVAGRAVFGALHRIMNKAWRVPEPRHFVMQQVRQVAMAMGVGVLLLVSVLLSTFGQIVAQGPGVLGVQVDFIQWAWATLFGLLPFFLSTVVFLLIFRLVPNAPVGWRQVAPPAALAALLFEASKNGFVLYLDRFASFDQVYGSISAVIVLLLWAYVASIILVVCAEVASEYSRSCESGQLRFIGSLRPVRGGFRPRVKAPTSALGES
jgi:membrane protein